MTITLNQLEIISYVRTLLTAVLRHPFVAFKCESCHLAFRSSVVWRIWQYVKQHSTEKPILFIGNIVIIVQLKRNTSRSNAQIQDRKSREIHKQRNSQERNITKLLMIIGMSFLILSGSFETYVSFVLIGEKQPEQPSTSLTFSLRLQGLCLWLIAPSTSFSTLQWRRHTDKDIYRSYVAFHQDLTRGWFLEYGQTERMNGIKPINRALTGII